MNENLDIFICTHTQPYTLPVNPVYKIVTQKKMDIDTNLEVICAEPEKMGQWGKMPRGLSELFNMYYVRHFVDKKDYIGFCQYRSFPFFFNKIPNMDEKLAKYDILTHRFNVVSIDKVYRSFLSQKDYEIYKDIFKTDYPDEYGKFLDEYLSQTEFSQRNTFIMRTEDFNTMLDFVFEVFTKYTDRINCHSDEDLYTRAINCITKNEFPEFCRDYQRHPLTLSRYLAYFGEAVISFYIWKNFEKRDTLLTFMTGKEKRDGE